MDGGGSAHTRCDTVTAGTCRHAFVQICGLHDTQKDRDVTWGLWVTKTCQHWLTEYNKRTTPMGAVITRGTCGHFL